jgi:hypothetical protein
MYHAMSGRPIEIYKTPNKALHSIHDKLEADEDPCEHAHQDDGESPGVPRDGKEEDHKGTRRHEHAQRGHFGR